MDPAGKKINETWHEKNVLGKNASLAKRISWHMAHLENCACYPLPTSIAETNEEKERNTCGQGHNIVGTGPVCWSGVGKRKPDADPGRADDSTKYHSEV